MTTFKYVAKDQNSRNITGKISADQKFSVVSELRRRNLTVISIESVKESGGTRIPFIRQKVKADDLVIFSRQLATMVDAGIPILHALDALQEQIVHPYFRSVIASVRDDIQLGSCLSVAFAKHGSAFDTLFINMVKVGETGGVLSAILDRISSYLEKTLKLKRKVKSAMIYPIVVVSMAIIITTVLLVKVVPTFASIYESFNQELPGMTQGLINVSNFLKTYIVYVVIGLFVTGFLLSRWYLTDKGKLIIDRAILKVPIFGELIRKVAVSRFCRTLGTLIQTGVPILEALEIVGKACGNRVFEIVVQNIEINVREGESIAAPLMKSGVFPSMVTRMISVGEKSGQLEKMLNKVADFYDDQVDTTVASLTSIIEPLIIGFLGLVVGVIVISLFLPIINITRIL